MSTVRAVVDDVIRDIPLFLEWLFDQVCYAAFPDDSRLDRSHGRSVDLYNSIIILIDYQTFQATPHRATTPRLKNTGLGFGWDMKVCGGRDPPLPHCCSFDRRHVPRSWRGTSGFYWRSISSADSLVWCRCRCWPDQQVSLGGINLPSLTRSPVVSLDLELLFLLRNI